MAERDYGMWHVLFPAGRAENAIRRRRCFEVIVEKEGLKFLGWREVPIHPEILGKKAVECMPCHYAGDLSNVRKSMQQGLDFDRRLYVVRRVFEQSSDDTYVVVLIKQNDRV